ncbi:MAG: Nif3-like dinuclear metal center hexameric protein [Erysipelotrichaceae bacterium]
MKVQDVMNHLEATGTWVNWDESRDYLIYGDSNQTITKVGVCWVATMQVIEQALHEGINFIISHENPFYHATTSPQRLVSNSINLKKHLLDQGNIAVYRCHDVWDKIPEYGVSDQWAKRLGFNFKRETSSYLQSAIIPEMSVKQLAQHVAHCLKQDGEDGVIVLGNLDNKVTRLAMGTGAATNIFEMLKECCDVVIVSDDGISNYYQAQYAIDNELPMIIVNHAGCEICGLKAMEAYFHKVMPELSVTYLKEGYKFQYIVD